jgi:CPA1 family monovalent cation:H+ antiporter
MDWFQEVEFAPALLQGMLGFLLFAGALHVDLGRLLEQKWIIGLLATGGVLISTVLVGLFTWLGADWVGLEIGLLHCLLFGALIAPTDPIAVLAVLKQAGVPPSVEMKIAGESLFNDGVGVVVFLVLLGLLGASGSHGGEPSPAGVVGLFAQEAIGGIAFGLGLGWLAYRMLRSVDNYQVEVLLTLALVTGGYALAARLHLSGPLAMVAAGLLVGNRGRVLGMSESTREHLDTFWELIDEGLNAVLFLMIGLEVLVLTFTREFLAAGLVGIPLVLLARFTSVGLMVSLLRLRRSFSPYVIPMLTWGGLRGGISVALALSLPPGPERDLIVAATYVIVAFSILVQGLTIGPLARRLYAT